MIQPEEFDAFYKDARHRLLLQTYALTGDLPAARSAVRDSFIVTWHHWRKVSRLPDAEAWVRPHAWAQAQRRHTARVWHRDKTLDPEAKATFDALGALSLAQRKTLVLDQLTTLPIDERARELGIPSAAVERQTAEATEKFLQHREMEPDQLAEQFSRLGRLVEDSRLPRPSILRRAGAARRRTHTAVGAAAAVAAVLLTGTAVSGSTAGGPPLEAESEVPTTGDPAPTDPAAEFTTSRLLAPSELDRLVQGRRWAERSTSDNSRGNGRVMPCQQERYADPKGLATMVRTFSTDPAKKDPTVSAVQYAELSPTTRASHRAWQRMLRWYAGCVTPRMQLIGTRTVDNVGDEARLFHLRHWRNPASTVVVGVARTGQVVTTTVTRTTAEGAPAFRDHARFLGASVNGLCAATPGAPCAGPPRLEEIAPIRVGDVPSLLIEADLPPVTNVSDSWIGTEPHEARSNAAATQCDRADFSGAGISNGFTRTFLIPGADVPPAFGITETVASMPTARAKGFVKRVRDRMQSCNDRDPGSEVTSLASSSSGDRDLALWRVTSELNDNETVTYLMGIARVGTSVAQVGFVPTAKVTMQPGAFDALVRRALARLAFHPKPKR